jgi:predicted molibdopterin-dependent oxidoreductase YjgC
VQLSTPNGSITVKANVTELAREGVAHMFHDYPEADVNTLLSGNYLDPISGFPGYKASLCSVVKVAPNAAGIQGVTR